MFYSLKYTIIINDKISCRGLFTMDTPNAEISSSPEGRQKKKRLTLPKPEKDDLRLTTILFDILVCFAAALLVSASLYYFSNYNGFAPGGITGIASIFATLTAKQFGEVTINMSIFMLLLNIPIFILAAILVSRKTGIMLIVYLVFQSLLLMLFKSLHTKYGIPYYGAIRGAECFQEGNNLVFASIGVGVISGFGFSLMIRRFGASGGTFAISALMKRFHPEKNVAWLSFAMDASVVVLAFFVYQSGANSVISTLANIFISDLVVDFMLQGLKSGYKFEIITDKADDLSAELMAKLGRGVTTLHAEGMYTPTDKALLICIVRKRQVGAFLKILKKYTSTFSYSCHVNEVYGKFDNSPKRIFHEDVEDRVETKEE